jgi:hypothetical protein
MGGSGHALDRNASMHNRVVHHSIVVDDGGLVVNRRDPRRRQTASVQVVTAEVAKADECKGADAQAKVEARSHADAIEPPAQPHIKAGERR